MSIESLVGLEQSTLRCPYATYAELQDVGVHWSDLLDAWVVSSYNDVVEVLRNHQVFSSSVTLGRPPRDPVTAGPNDSPLLLLSDQPDHTRFRRIVSRAFTPNRVASWEPQIQALCDALIDEMVGRTELDFVEAFSGPLPIAVITSVLGVPQHDAPTFRHYSEELTRSLGGGHEAPEDVLRVRREFAARIDGLIDEALGVRSAHILPVIAEARDAGVLTAEESTRFVMELIVAGNITTSHHLTSSIMLLASDPTLADRLRTDAGKGTAFIEESLRLESPIQGFYRLVTVDTEIGDQQLPAGSRVFVLYAAANRDASVWGDVDGLDLERAHASRHVAFGFGIHTCLGAPLARVEGRLAIESLLSRLPAFELAEPRDELPWLASFVNHGPTRLPLRVTWETT